MFISLYGVLYGSLWCRLCFHICGNVKIVEVEKTPTKTFLGDSNCSLEAVRSLGHRCLLFHQAELLGLPSSSLAFGIPLPPPSQAPGPWVTAQQGWCYCQTIKNWQHYG